MGPIERSPRRTGRRILASFAALAALSGAACSDSRSPKETAGSQSTQPASTVNVGPQESSAQQVSGTDFKISVRLGRFDPPSDATDCRKQIAMAPAVSHICDQTNRSIVDVIEGRVDEAGREIRVLSLRRENDGSIPFDASKAQSIVVPPEDAEVVIEGGNLQERERVIVVLRATRSIAGGPPYAGVEKVVLQKA